MKTLTLTCLATLAALASLIAPGLAHAEPESGMLLGVYAFENWRGLRVINTIPGYSAHGTLFSGDTLLRATTDGVNVYSIRTHHQIEWAKDQIGPYQLAAIEYWRPGFGLQYVWVEFRPVGGGAAYMMKNGVAVQKKMQAKFYTEAEKPGAKLLFQKGLGGLGIGNGNGGNGGVVPGIPGLPGPGFPGVPGPGVPMVPGPMNDPSSLFK